MDCDNDFIDNLDDRDYYCPGSMNNKHKVDFSSAHSTRDGGKWYVDVKCAHCGRLGCLGMMETLSEGATW